MDNTKTALAALAYMTEATLATVEMLKCKAKPPRRELLRQQTMANFGINNLRGLGYTKEDAKSHRYPRLVEEL